MIRFCIGLCLTLLLNTPAFAAANDYSKHFAEACAHWKVPLKLVLAISKLESGHNPWAVNVQGKPYQFKTKEEAVKLANAAHLAGKSYDVGLMQVNSYWIRRFKLKPAFVIEPKNNIYIGTWILAQGIKRYGLTWKAVGSYHTSVENNESRAVSYAKVIIQQLKKMP